MSKTATIYSNDPANREVRVSISGTVEKFVTIQPKRVRLFGRVGEAASTTVIIKPEPKYPFRILEITPRSGGTVQCKQEDTGGNAEGYKLAIRNIRTTPGRYTEVINIKTDSKIQPQLRVYVYGNIVASSPAQSEGQSSDAAQNE